MYVYIEKTKKSNNKTTSQGTTIISNKKYIYVCMIVELLWSIDRRGPTVIPNCYFENNAVTL